MCNAGLIPERTPDPRRAFHLWSSDGAVILTTNRTDIAGMLAGAQDVFGPRLLVHQSPTTFATNTTPTQDTYYDPVTRTVNSNPGVALELHIDGYMMFGDYYPDLVFLLCERPAPTGGESFIVDGQRLIGAIAGDPTQRGLNRFLWDVTLEQNRPRCGRPGRNRQARPEPPAGGVADLQWAPHGSAPPTPTPPR